MQQFTFLFFLAFLLTFSSIGYAQSNPWELKSKKGDLEVYYRDAPDSDFKELKITTQLDAPLSTVIAAMSDVDAFPDWVYKCSEAVNLKQVSDTELYYYVRMDLPWPFHDRDLISHSTLRQDPDTKVVISEGYAVPNYVDEKKDVIRVPTNNIKWVITPLDNGLIDIEYTLKSSPGGSVPAWLMNLAIDHGPVQTMLKFKEMLKMDKYQNQKLAYIRD